MNRRLFKGTVSNFGTVSVIMLLMTGPVLAEPPASLQPGGYFNPWVVRQDRNGEGTIQADKYTGGSPLAPGSIYNPYIIERNGKELQIRPEFPYQPKEDNGDGN